MIKHREREVKFLGRRRRKDYFCTVVSECLEITLKYKASSGYKSKNEPFVQCNQPECQYFDLNQIPCPLCLDLFSEYIKKAKRKSQK